MILSNRQKQKKKQLVVFVALRELPSIRFLEINQKWMLVQVKDIIETREKINFSSIFKNCFYETFLEAISELQNGQNIDDAICRYHKYGGYGSACDSHDDSEEPDGLYPYANY